MGVDREPAPWWAGHADLLPPEPELEPVHQRDYLIRAYRRDDESLLIRGAVMDIRPGQQLGERIKAAGGQDDGRPLTIHHMVIDLTVVYPELTIVDADVVFETHPQPECPLIAPRTQDRLRRGGLDPDVLDPRDPRTWGDG